MDINAILIALLIVGGLGLIIGLILAITSLIFAVPKDEITEKLTQALPGANCGACGFSGCAGYAKAIKQGKAKIGLCPVGGDKVAKELSSILGIKSEGSVKKVALVKCMGNYDNTDNKANYQGLSSCLAASKISQGITACSYGCIGLGDCTKVCKFDAISVCNGVAVVDSNKCKGCSMCVRSCPRQIISLVEVKDMAIVRCSSHDKGAQVRKLCKTGCIGCMKCQKNCPSEAITITNFLAYVDPEKCTACKICVDNCPVHCITFFEEQTN